MPYSSATASSMRVKYWVPLVRHGAIAPALIDMSGSGMISSGSTSKVVPRPKQASHAP